MNEAKIAQFERAIVGKLADLAAQDDLGAEGQKTVILDQRSVGRLSRMDALQGQAMAQATAARRAQDVAKLISALERIKKGEFGYCLDCGEEVAEARLVLDPAVTLCITCARG